MKLHDVNRGVVKHRKTKRLGRGPGTGQGKTAGRGHKGQGQLAGWTTHPAFEGGQTPVYRRVPKRGFNNRWALVIRAINLAALEAAFADGDEVTPETLRERKVARGRYDELKVLADGELTKKLKISAHRFSERALEKIKQAGGEAIVLAGAMPVSEKSPRKKRTKA
jgi:large subunit ribosomal protein L15